MKYVVTGSCGFIGSNLVDYLVKKGHYVIGIDDLSTGKKEYKNTGARYYIKDINDYELMHEVTENVDGVFHLAAWARLQRSIDDPIGTNHANIDGTVSVLEACRRSKVKRVILSSSSSVYGLHERFKMQEDMALNPMHFYALQKVALENYGRLYSKLFDMEVVCLRYFNVYGKRQITDGDYALVIGKFLKQKSEGKAMTVYGDGNQTRAYTHVEDVVRANELAMEYVMNVGTIFKQGKYDFFNIGTDKETSINKIVEMLGGRSKYIIPNPRGNFEELRKCADYSKAEKRLGWKPEITIEEGIKALCV